MIVLLRSYDLQLVLNLNLSISEDYCRIAYTIFLRLVYLISFPSLCSTSSLREVSVDSRLNESHPITVLNAEEHAQTNQFDAVFVKDLWILTCQWKLVALATMISKSVVLLTICWNIAILEAVHLKPAM